MDTFFEQIVKIKKTSKAYMGYFLITLLSLLVIAASWLFLRQLVIVIAALIVWGAFKMYSMFEVEYEYIITNSCFDIDKIVAKSSRKRIFSFDLAAVERIEKYRKELPQDLMKNAFFACNGTEDDAVVMVVQPKGKSKMTVVVVPNERMRDAMKKFLPKYISENL